MHEMTNAYKTTSSEETKKREEKEMQKLLSRAQKLQQMQVTNAGAAADNTAPQLPEELPPPLPPTPVNASGQPAPAQMKFSLKSAPKKAAPKMNAFKAFSDDD